MGEEVRDHSASAHPSDNIAHCRVMRDLAHLLQLIIKIPRHRSPGPGRTQIFSVVLLRTEDHDGLG